MIQKLPFALIGIAVLLLAFFLYTEHTTSVPEETRMVYEGTNYTFSYPPGYVITQTPEGVMVVKEGDTVIPVAGEGPTGITITMHAVSEGETLTDWLTVGDSNYELGPEAYIPAQVDGIDAVRYSWSGLYEGETTAFMQESQVVAISRTWMSRGDHAQAYETILRTYTRK